MKRIAHLSFLHVRLSRRVHHDGRSGWGVRRYSDSLDPTRTATGWFEWEQRLKQVSQRDPVQTRDNMRSWNRRGIWGSGKMEEWKTSGGRKATKQWHFCFPSFLSRISSGSPKKAASTNSIATSSPLVTVLSFFIVLFWPIALDGD